MPALTNVLSSLNLLGLGGVAIFLWYLYKGLLVRIRNLTELAEEQGKTLAAARDRAEEMDRLIGTYKQAVADFETLGKKLDARRNELVSELEDANKRQEKELARLASLELEEIELRQQSWERLPKLEADLRRTLTDLREQWRIVSHKEAMPLPPTSLATLLGFHSAYSEWPAYSIIPAGELATSPATRRAWERIVDSVLDEQPRVEVIGDEEPEQPEGPGEPAKSGGEPEEEG